MALAMLAICPALAMAAPTITQPVNESSWVSTPTFGGSSNGTLNSVTLWIYPGHATSGSAVTSETVSPSLEGTWAANPGGLAPGTYTGVASESNEVLAEERSNPVTITIIEPASAPLVTSNPSSKQAGSAGEAVTFHASATGSPAPSVQWEVFNGGGWAADTGDAGNTSETLTVAATSEKNGYQYRATFHNEAGNATSSSATLKVPPTVTANPQPASVSAGGTATFTASASGNPAPEVTWYESTNGFKNVKQVNGGTQEAVAGGTSSTLTLEKVPAEKSGTEYLAWFHNSGGGKGTASAKLSVARSAPVVTQNPSSTIIAIGYSATFTAAASGAPTPSVQWEESRNGGASWGPVPGATSTTFTTKPENEERELLFRACFSNEAGHECSQPAVLDVTSPHAPVVFVNPLSTTVPAGGTATFTAAASGPPQPTVQWQESANGGATWASIPGATEYTLRIAGASVALNGHQFRAVFTNEKGSAISGPATLGVTPPPPPPAPASLVAGFSWFPPTPHVGEPVSFASTSTDDESAIVGFGWDFAGNGPFAPAGPLVGTTFSTPGAHHVRLRAAAANGVVREVGQTINVLPKQLNVMQPFPVVRMAGSLNSAGVKVTLLTVQAPLGATVSARCVGRHCPYKLERALAKPRTGSTRVPPVTLWHFERFLRAGVVLQIKVYKAGQVGKYTSFTIRRRRLPVRVDECLDPDLFTPMICPGS